MNTLPKDIIRLILNEYCNGLSAIQCLKTSKLFRVCFTDRQLKDFQKRCVRENIQQKQDYYYEKQLQTEAWRTSTPISLMRRCSKCNKLLSRSNPKHECSHADDVPCNWCHVRFGKEGPHYTMGCPLRPQACKYSNESTIKQMVIYLPHDLNATLEICKSSEICALERKYHEKDCRLKCGLCEEYVLGDRYLSHHISRGGCTRIPFTCKWLCKAIACENELVVHEEKCRASLINCPSCGDLFARKTLISNGRLYRCDFCAFKQPTVELHNPYTLKRPPKVSNVPKYRSIHSCNE